MYEITVALKYLIPRWRQLSVSIISLISVVVIALVVWLIVVFFSVTHGLEKSWIQKMIALSAPVRLTPTEAYHESFYYQSDSISANADYTVMSIGEKLENADSISYDPEIDEAPPAHWPELERHANGEPVDIVKEAFESVKSVKGIAGIRASDYEMTVANLNLHVAKEGSDEQQDAYMNQVVYLGSFEAGNQAISDSLIAMDGEDFENVLKKIQNPTDMKRCFDSLCITELKTPENGWAIPKHILPDDSSFEVLAFFRGNVPTRLILPDSVESGRKFQQTLNVYGYQVSLGKLSITDGKYDLYIDGSDSPIPLSRTIPIILNPNSTIPAKIATESIENAHHVDDVMFDIHPTIQGSVLSGQVLYKHLKIGSFMLEGDAPFWVEKNGEFETLPSLNLYSDGILLPKNFKKSNVRVGDSGYISYFTPTASSMQEQRAPVYIAGFYDPGIISMGGKFIVTNKELTNLIRSSYDQNDSSFAANGINVRFDNFEEAESVKEAIIKQLKERGIDQYWRVETYHEYDFSRDLVQQLKSEKFLFTILSTIIIIVACSNIISMLIILVNDKRTEIGILRAMGASSKSIAMIFGLCGVVMGLFGSVVGIVIAKFTLNHLDQVVGFISALQGHEMFNPLFYGDSLPNEVSSRALFFVLLSTALISLIAGIVPAMKASTVNPATILRSE